MNQHELAKKEEEFLLGQFNEKYTEYCRLVPRFFPRLTPAKLSEKHGSFSWKLILKYREQWRFIRILGLIIFCYLRMVIGEQTDLSFIKDTLKEPINATLVIVLAFILCLPPLYEFVIKKLWKADK